MTDNSEKFFSGLYKRVSKKLVDAHSGLYVNEPESYMRLSDVYGIRFWVDGNNFRGSRYRVRFTVSLPGDERTRLRVENCVVFHNNVMPVMQPYIVQTDTDDLNKLSVDVSEKMLMVIDNVETCIAKAKAVSEMIENSVKEYVKVLL